MRKLSQRLRDANRQIESLLDHNGAVCAIRLLRGLAGPERDGWRPLPQGTGPAALSASAGLPPGEAQGIWERLRAIGLVVELPAPRLATERMLDEYLAYLELKQRYDPLSVRELSEVTGLPEDEVHQVVRRLLASRLEGQGKLVDPYQHFLSLKKRFEYLDRV
jgi:DNA-binding IclR family transcriptional regulator